MTTRILLIHFLLLIIFSANAQQYTSQELSKEEGKDGDSPNLISSPTGYYSIRHLGKSKFGYSTMLYDFTYAITITSYDHQMKKIKSGEIFRDEDRPRPFISRLLKLGGKEIFLYYQKQEKQNELFDVFASEIDPVTLEPKNKKKLFEVEQENVGIFKMGQLEAHKMITQESPDGKRILFLHTSVRTNKYSYTILDRDLNILKTKTQVVEAAGSIQGLSTITANNGDLFISYRIPAQKNEKTVRTVVKEQFDNTQKSMILNTDDEISPITMNITQGIDEKDILITGTYSDNDYTTTGIYIQRLDRNTLQVIHKSMKSIPDELIDKYIEDKFSYKKDKKKGIMSETPFVAAAFHHNSVCLLGELTTVYNSEKYGRIYRKGDILAVLIKNDNITFTNFPKTTETTSGNNPNYHAMMVNDKLMLFYDSQKEKLTGSLPESSLSGKKKSYFVVTSLTKDGITSTSLISGDRDKFGGMDGANMIINPGNSLTVPYRSAKGLGGIKEIVTYYLFKPVGE